MGLTVELVTFLGSTVLGGLLKVWGMSNESKNKQQEMLLERFNVSEKSRRAARNNKDKSFQWTKRFITIAAILSIIVLPLVAAVLIPDLIITHGWTEWKPGFLFIEGKDTMIWHEVRGLVITPMHTALVAAIAGTYYGSSIVSSR